MLHQLPYLPCSVWLYMSTFKIFQALPQGHGDNEFNPIGHSQIAAASCKSHNLIVLSHAPLSALPVKTRFALRTCWNGTFHFLHLLEASAQFTLNQEFVKTAHDCTQLRARASVHVWFLCLCDANPIFAFGAPERYTRYSISVAS